MKLELWYPAKPYRLTQTWGIYRPEIYKRFGFTRHNGVDFALGGDWLVRAEFPCKVHNIGWQPEGGGRFVSVISKEEYEFADGKKAYVLVDYLHLVINGVQVKKGDELEIGQVIARADNTGFSTGPHTHAQYRRVDKDIKMIEWNEANGSFDPEPYRNGFFAVEYQNKKKSDEIENRINQLDPSLARFVRLFRWLLANIKN